MNQQQVNDLVQNVAFRGEEWWHQTDNSLRTAVETLPMAASVKDWIGQVAVQAWTEGAVTAVQEYGDEMRAADAEFDRFWARDMVVVNAWRAAHPGNDLVLPDMGVVLDWLLQHAGILPAPLTTEGVGDG